MITINLYGNFIQDIYIFSLLMIKILKLVKNLNTLKSI